MIRATVKTFQRFPQFTARLDRAAALGVQEAAEVAAAVAQANASIDLELEVVEAHADAAAEGYAAGIRARKKTRNPKKTTPIARFFDEGTLGKRRKTVKRPRKGTWDVAASERASAHTASRRDLESKGVDAEHFFAKARTAGKKAMLERVEREMQV